MFDFKFTLRRKQRKMLSELKNRRHAEDDLLSDAQRKELDEAIAEFASSAPADFAAASARAEERFGKICRPWSGIRNLLDLLIVVGAVAFGIRGLYLQPFKIPTSSMQPTLYGIHFMHTTPLGKELPAFVNYALFSARRAYAKTEEAGEIVMEGYSNRVLWDDVKFSVAAERFSLPGAPRKVWEYSGVENGRLTTGKETLADGFLSLGDHLFVERFSLYFNPPQRGEIMVFTTDGLQVDGNPLSASSGSYYVKRLMALPGDTVRLRRNQLWIRPAGGKEFLPIQKLAPRTAKLYSGKGGYQGHLSRMGDVELFGASSDYTVPPDHYFMLGDNSLFSLDSRFFGAVPRRNLVGRTCFIFWPFSRRWGIPDTCSPVERPTGIPKRGTFPVMYHQ